MGYRTIAIARGADRETLARELGTHEYIDGSRGSVGAALAALGGADLIVSTAPSTESAAELLDGLNVHGRLTLIGVDGGLVAVPVAPMVMKHQTLAGHLTGSPHDTELAMRFADTNGVRPIVERMALTEANHAIDRLRDGVVRFRVVFDTASQQ